jgi:hypothetical protein
VTLLTHPACPFAQPAHQRGFLFDGSPKLAFVSPQSLNAPVKSQQRRPQLPTAAVRESGFYFLTASQT